jgi:hypothetical protein
MKFNLIHAAAEVHSSHTEEEARHSQHQDSASEWLQPVGTLAEASQL